MILKTRLLPHQIQAIEKLKRLRIGGLLMEMGLGKTRVMIEIVHSRRDRINNVLWFCPVSLKTTIASEIRKHVLNADVYIFNDKTTQETIPDKFWNVIGIESISSSKRTIYSACELVRKRSCVIVDESSYIKGHRSNRTKWITAIGQKAHYRYILSGTPMTQGIVDLYSQMRFLDERILGYRSFYQFAANHLEYSEKYPGMIRRSHNVKLIAAKIAPYCYQVTKEECLPLPKKVYDSRYFTMSDEQEKLYQEAKQRAFERIAGEEYPSHIIFKLFTELQQIVNGFIKEENTNSPPTYRTLEEYRTETLLSVIDSIPAHEKIIIWAKYQRDIISIQQTLNHHHGNDSVALFCGTIPQEIRDMELVKFRRKSRFLIATPACGGHGLTLNESAYVIFYSNEFKYSNRLQAEDRNHRIGQSRPVTYIDLICSGSIDERIHECLNKKGNLVEEFKREVDKLRSAHTLKKALNMALGDI